MSDFTSIQFTLAERLKKVKSKKELSSVFTAEKEKYYWAGMHKCLIYDTSISLGAKILWLILEDVGDANGYSYYKQSKLSKMIGKDVRMMQRYTRELVNAGWLIVKPGRTYRSNEYWVIWPDECPNPKLNSMIKKSKAAEKRY